MPPVFVSANAGLGFRLDEFPGINFNFVEGKFDCASMAKKFGLKAKALAEAIQKSSLYGSRIHGAEKKDGKCVLSAHPLEDIAIVRLDATMLKHSYGAGSIEEFVSAVDEFGDELYSILAERTATLSGIMVGDDSGEPGSLVHHPDDKQAITSKMEWWKARAEEGRHYLNEKARKK